jgi:mono/diheme cytochrome c family protein
VRNGLADSSVGQREAEKEETMRRWMAGAVAVLFITIGAAAQEWKAPADAKATKNPVAKAAGIKDGKAAYDANCAVCHGAAGKGDGPGATALNPKPRNLADKAIQGQTDGELFWKISVGRSVMPPWKHLPERERWSLVHYIRSLTGKK